MPEYKPRYFIHTKQGCCTNTYMWEKATEREGICQPVDLEIDGWKTIASSTTTIVPFHSPVMIFFYNRVDWLRCGQHERTNKHTRTPIDDITRSQVHWVLLIRRWRQIITNNNFHVMLQSLCVAGGSFLPDCLLSFFLFLQRRMTAGRLMATASAAACM